MERKNNIKIINKIIMFVLFFTFFFVRTTIAEILEFKKEPFVLETTLREKISVKRMVVNADENIRYLTINDEKGSIERKYIKNMKQIMLLVDRQINPPLPITRKEYENNLENEKIKKEKKKELERITRERTLKEAKNCFNFYDGSHYILVKLIKDSMNDPDSFKHDKT